MSSSLPQLLNKLKVVWGLADHEVDALAEKMNKLYFSAGSFIYKQGDQGDAVYVVDVGQVSAITNMKVPTSDGEGAERKDIFIKNLSTGDTSGFYSMLENRPHAASLKCITDVEAYAINRPDFEELLLKFPQLSRQLLKSLSIKLQLVRRDFLTLKSISAPTATQEVKEEPGKGLKIAVFDVKPYWRPVFAEILRKYPGITVSLKDTRLNEETVYLAAGHDAVCCFVNDTVNKQVVTILHQLGVRLILMRCAGFNNLDLHVCDTLGLTIARVPKYSPYAVAEHAAALILSLNRKVHVAYQRVREGNFTLNGLVGFDLYGKTIGIAGTGKIGMCFMSIAAGFGCKILCYDIYQDPNVSKYGATYVPLDQLLKESDVISLHLPLLKETTRIINKDTLAKMKKGVILINTSRGALINTADLIDSLKSGHLGGAGLDVFENETGYFFEDWSDRSITDDQLSRLLTFKNVIVTSHQAFLTTEALSNIVTTTLDNAKEFLDGKRMCELTNTLNEVDRLLRPKDVKKA